MIQITLYKVREDGVFNGEETFYSKSVEALPIPPNYTNLNPHPIPQNHYAIMTNKREYIEGETPEPPAQNYAAQNKAQASTLLQQTDWVELDDVADPANPPYLSNKPDFTAYRAALRSIAVTPPTTPAVFPAKPDEVWLS
jgi:hypothetical protein